ncbi:hypothetical protein [Mycobacterium branderi]|uniref:Uncharacterized protein n=1 Tax=Mycobacterium branderi TaxID=43348 RepID=A0A7I7WGC8_9MYCO|nr:hypothetical protein [Mycobacterium branderi]MCV7231822.1 hypothetical protein [Mycobacterium branderi]ORA40226.1 hypothetical protein BST20_06600 [Mycobacterium branderi]BBZ15523.1 hypothetical protein MBRA_57180 [Mycobacterium branderi]
MIETITADEQTLAVAGLFSSGKGLGLAAVCFLAVVALVVGTAHSVKAHTSHGAGSGITGQIGTIIHVVLIVLSLGIAAAVVAEARHHGIQNPINVETPWGP